MFLVWSLVGTVHMVWAWYLHGIRKGTGEAVYGPAWPEKGEKKGERKEAAPGFR